MENDFRKNMVGAEAYSHLMEFIRVYLHIDTNEMKRVRKIAENKKKNQNDFSKMLNKPLFKIKKQKTVIKRNSLRINLGSLKRELDRLLKF